MEWILIPQEQYRTTCWAGGVTTQLAIAPEGAGYADREFLWRISSAKVELDHSNFTRLPGYHRLLSVLDGKLELKVGEDARFSLAPYQVCAFDGGVPVESWGQCTDFNLMMRKGACEGAIQPFFLIPNTTLTVTTALPATEMLPNTVLALYCAAGSVFLPKTGMTVQNGQLLLCQSPGSALIRMRSAEGATLMAVSMRSE